MNHPYKQLADYHFWYEAVTNPAPGHIDPVTKFQLIDRDEKVSTMGSCFAQHLSNNIKLAGFNYFISEDSPQFLPLVEKSRKNYGLFSARYGNVYTARQALQLFDRAFDIFKPIESAWSRGDVFVDPFRPLIDPDGFASEQLVVDERVVHLNAVKRVFQESQWLIFTLGLTEAWRSKLDGAIYPVSPGVSGGIFDPNLYEFVNFSANEVIKDLTDFVNKILGVNPQIKILLTVSPVPLIATYENRHVLVSTSASKATLRVAADEIEKLFHNVIYFPSYEIITSPASGQRYYQDDLRQVTQLGVNHVMRVFSKHFMGSSDIAIDDQGMSLHSPAINLGDSVICDEETIYSAIKASGF